MLPPWQINAIEARVQMDEGGRGIGAFKMPSGELLKSAHTLYDHSVGAHAQSTEGAESEVSRADGGTASDGDGVGVGVGVAAILTGFPCLIDHTPPTETDGPVGAVAIARAVLGAGGSAALLTDDCNVDVLRAAVEGGGLAERLTKTGLSVGTAPLAVEPPPVDADAGADAGSLQIMAFPPAPWATGDDAAAATTPDHDQVDQVDHDVRLSEVALKAGCIVAIERTGPGRDGGYVG